MRKLTYFLLLLSLTQTGCGIGGHWMNGDPFYKPYIKPYIAYWTKEGITEESRLNDWVECGGLPDGSFALDRKKRLPEESSDIFRTRLEFEFQRCMLRANYHYTGNCSSEHMKARPLCNSPWGQLNEIYKIIIDSNYLFNYMYFLKIIERI